MFKLWSLPRKRSAKVKLHGVEHSVRIGGFTLDQAGGNDPNVSIEFWADDRRYVIQIPLDKVDSVAERLIESKQRQEKWMLQQRQRREV
jgi:hypothetical protein